MSPGRGGRQNIRYISILPPLNEVLPTNSHFNFILPCCFLYYQNFVLYMQNRSSAIRTDSEMKKTAPGLR